MPDCTDPNSFNQRFVSVASGNRYHLVDQAPPHWVGDLSDAPVLLLLHGFPDLWYGWRYRKAFLDPPRNSTDRAQ